MEDGDFDFEVLQLTLSIHGCHGGSIITKIDLRGYWVGSNKTFLVTSVVFFDIKKTAFWIALKSFRFLGWMGQIASLRSWERAIRSGARISFLQHRLPSMRLLVQRHFPTLCCNLKDARCAHNFSNRPWQAGRWRCHEKWTGHRAEESSLWMPFGQMQLETCLRPKRE